VSGSKFFAENTAYRYLSVRFIYAEYHYGKAKIDNDLLKGDYKQNDIFFFAMNANWKF
jgi:vancomycin permeability regulator SanA